MTASRSINAFIICTILLLAANPLLAANQENLHANPSLIQQDRYGPVRPNDTLWSIAKLFVKKGESVNTVIAELEQANPKAIKPGSNLLQGTYIHRRALNDSRNTIRPKIQLEAEIQTIAPKLIFQSPEFSQPLLVRNIPEISSSTPLQNNVEKESPSSIFPYILISLSILGSSLFLGLRRVKHKRLQQQIEQEEMDKINALKRESIKNRLKPASD